ncbi:MAG: hypothetical protein COB51_13970 [Moraxellaceae bacterium]|nr:MAG: hypothetical protein COB51_13970 [Moraxellaceae bacterium]
MSELVSNANSSLPEGVEIVTRQVKLNHLKNKPRYWHHDDPFMSHLINAASIFLPEGERFFIRSFLYFINEVDDETLRNEIKEFVTQEGIHGDEHSKFNQDLIDNLGYDFLETSELRIKQIFAFYNRFTSKKFQLAITLSAEHFTAIIAEMVLRNPQLMEGVEPKYLELWHWHLMEELEHKGVAMDLYNAVDGSYWKRCVAIVLILSSIVPYIGFVFYKLLKQDGMISKELWRKQKLYHKGNSPVFRQLWVDFKSFFKRGFHPWQHDNSDLIVELNTQFYKQGIIKRLPKSTSAA